MNMRVRTARTAVFGPYVLDLRSGELRKFGTKVKMGEQPFQILRLLLETPGEMVTREELREKLWAKDTFVDFDHGLNSAVQRLRDCLSDTAGNPRWVEAIPRRGYRFVGQVKWSNGVDPSRSNGEPAALQGEGTPVAEGDVRSPRFWPRFSVGFRIVAYCFAAAVVALLAGAALFTYRAQKSSAPARLRALTRLTFDAGLQFGATWSPDGHFIAYSSNRGGKFDIWVQQVSGGDPVQITKGPGQNWQPDWSPDGKYIAYRSEDNEGGLFVVPALGGAGLERRIASFGYYPRWSPDGSQVMFQTTHLTGGNRIYVVGLDGTEPREIVAEFLRERGGPLSAEWHPDGKRLSVWMWEVGPSPSFWTIPIAGGAPVKSVIPPDVARQFGDVAVGARHELVNDRDFSWANSGRAIYFERTFRGARNIWKMSVDPETLQATAIERLTTGPGMDTEFAISKDGRMAFTVEAQHVRSWLFPFDATRERVTGAGRAITAPGVENVGQALTPDGKKLAFAGNRAGKWDLWEKSLVDGREVRIVADDYNRCCLRWSRDGTRLAYIRFLVNTGQQLMMWSSQTRIEEPLTTSSKTYREVWDWSPDGKWILISQGDGDPPRAGLRLLPVIARPQAETASRKITSNPDYFLFQGQFSPDGRWIVFEAVRASPTLTAQSSIYLIPAAGGQWTRVSGEGVHWDDKPRWSPDGKTIYFVSGSGGFFNVWGIRFDPTRGKPLGEPFRVTDFVDPALMLPDQTPMIDLSVTQDHLALPLEDLSGSIWVLDNVGR